MLKEIAPDAIVTNGAVGASLFVGPARRLGIPLFPILHGVGTYENDIANLRSRLACRVLDKTACVVGISNVSLARYLPFLKAPHRLIYNAIEPFALKPEEGLVFRREHGLPENGIIIGVLSRICPSKAVVEFVDAIAMLVQRCPAQDIIAVIGGEPGSDTEKQL